MGPHIDPPACGRAGRDSDTNAQTSSTPGRQIMLVRPTFSPPAAAASADPTPFRVPCRPGGTFHHYFFPVRATALPLLAPSLLPTTTSSQGVPTEIISIKARSMRHLAGDVCW
ncbi:unnamed protein product [Calypogeia fissa]